MISLCITGLSHSAIAAAERALLAAGMASAKPVQRDNAINFASWHHRVQEAMKQSATGQVADGASASIGRLWEQLASDLFLSNMQAPVWGWADANSLVLLEYWLGFDASTHFVLLATSPEQMLAEHLARLSRDSESSFSSQQMDSLMLQWHDAHQGMLRFALRNPTRCVLLQADEMPLPALVKTVQAAWPRQLGALRSELVVSVEASGATNGANTHKLLRHFATDICAGYPQLQALKYEVESVAVALTDATSSDASDSVLASVLATVSLADQVPGLNSQIAKLRSDLEFEASRSASALSQHQAQAQAQLLASAESIEKERAAYALAAQTQATLMAQVKWDLENELQVSARLASRRDKEELEKIAALALIESIKAQLSDAQSQVENLSAELSQTREQLERDALDAASLQARLVASEQALSQLQAKSQAEHLELIQTFDKERSTFVQEADAFKNMLAELNLQISQQRQEKADALAQCELETKAKFALAVQRDALVASGAVLDTESRRVEALLRSIEEENTLLLVQLSQVQHELERYYLRNKEIGTGADQWARRFSRVLSRQADGIDWESSRAELIDGAQGAQLRCYASQVAVTGKVWDALEFTARIHAGALEYIFDRLPGQSNVFTRWPLSASKATQLCFNDGMNSASDDGAGVLREISTSDWDLLRGLPKLLGHALAHFKGPWPKGLPRLQAWQEAANATAHAFHRQPMALRFDMTRLQASKVSADREYLLLRIEQLSLANKRFNSFEFRFGCSLGKAGEFAQNARLEFVKGNTEAAFETWIPNVRDVEGERLDLVFVFPTSMNLKDWIALSINDRGLVLLLADQLPTILGALVLDNVSLVRPLAQWIALAEKLRIFVRTRLDVTGVQQVMPDTVASNLQLLSEKIVAPRSSNTTIKVRSQKVAAKALPKKSTRVSAGASKV